jgi:hypothetical protein
VRFVRQRPGAGYELVWTSNDGRVHIELSDDASELIRRRRALEHWLRLDGWNPPRPRHTDASSPHRAHAQDRFADALTRR